MLEFIILDADIKSSNGSEVDCHIVLLCALFCNLYLDNFYTFNVPFNNNKKESTHLCTEGVCFFAMSSEARCQRQKGDGLVCGPSRGILRDLVVRRQRLRVEGGGFVLMCEGSSKSSWGPAFSFTSIF